jgi:phosphoribosylformimino-5-aminoimidazole carboxamide ribotide isomerase
MPILPVLDLLGGVVVRGVAGRRAEYRPLVSRLSPSAGPLDVAQALAQHFRFREFYVADLDAIGGAEPALDCYRRLQAAGFGLWVDAGLRREADCERLLEAGVGSVIAGLETMAGPETLATLVRRVGPARLVFSLDLKEGQPLGCWAGDPWQIACAALKAGVRRMLILDLARVGMGQGTGTEELCVRLRQLEPTLEITTGGGVRGMDDVRRLQEHGANHVLVASALHDGRIDAKVVLSLRARTLSSPGA